MRGWRVWHRPGPAGLSPPGRAVPQGAAARRRRSGMFVSVAGAAGVGRSGTWRRQDTAQLRSPDPSTGSPVVGSGLQQRGTVQAARRADHAAAPLAACAASWQSASWQSRHWPSERGMQ